MKSETAVFLKVRVKYRKSESEDASEKVSQKSGEALKGRKGSPYSPREGLIPSKRCRRVGRNVKGDVTDPSK